MDLSLPAVIGITTPGNSTVFLNGKIGKTSGISSLLIISSSSGVINGINSESSFRIFDRDKLSNVIIFDLLMGLLSVIMTLNSLMKIQYNFFIIFKYLNTSILQT